jgi:hypothetical protein
MPILVIVTSCSSGPPPPIPWFNEHLQIEEVDYPSGVSFRIIREDSSDFSDFTEYLVVTNTSSTPLFFAAISYWGGSIDDLDQPCPNFNLCLKVVSGQAFQWDILNIYEVPPSPWEYGWMLVNEFGPSDPLKLYFSGRSLGNFTYSVLKTEPRNVFSIGDLDRPENVSIPLPQSIELPYIYGADELNVKLTVSYSLNESYLNYESFNYSGIFNVCIAGSILVVIIASIAMVLLFNRFLDYLAKRARSRNEEQLRLD